MKLFFEPVPHQEAIAFLQTRAAVTREVFDELTPELKGLAFVITGINDATQLQAAKNILAKLPAGTNYDDVKDELIAALPFSGIKAERRAELLLRHWGGVAYAQAQYRQQDRQRSIFPWWQYVTMGDGRVRASHVALGGVILRHDDPFWQGHYPPWEPLCRCSVIPLMDADVEEIQAAEAHLPPEQRSVLEGTLLKKLHDENILVRGPNLIHDVRTPAQKGDNWVGWDPDNITKGIDIEAYKKTLDTDVWDKLVKFWKSKWVDKTQTVHQWLAKTGPKKPAPVKAKPTPPPPAPPIVLPGHGTSIWLAPESWPKPLLQLPGNPTSLWLDPKTWPKPKLQLPSNGTTLWLDRKTWPKKARKPRAKKAPAGDGLPVPAVTSLIPHPDTLTLVQKLGGSTGAELRKAEDGSLWVVKKGNSPDHVRDEFLADQLYAAAGLRVPPCQLFETVKGPVKVAQFIEGKTLAAWQQATPAAKQADTLRLIRDGFATDALLGNWDVAGAGNDNLLIDSDGQPWRIDNGGSLRFRAQGGLKNPQEWSPEVRDLRTLLDPTVNPQAAKLFAGLTADDIATQIEQRLLPARDGILATAATAGPATRALLEARLDWMRRQHLPFSTDEIAAISGAGVRGFNQLGDEDLVEDLNILYWTEKSDTGADITRVRLKLTEAGSAAIVATVGSELTTPAGAAPNDPWWQHILPVLKHVGAHAASDKIYSPFKMATVTALKPLLTALAATDPATAQHYLDQIEAIEKAAATHIPPAPGSFSVYVPPATAAARRGRFGVQATNYTYTGKKLDGGRAEDSANSIWSTDAYRVTRPEADLAFVPWKLPNGSDSPAPYALRGYVDIKIPGLPDKSTLGKAQALLTELGVDTTPAPVARRELLHLAKGLRLAKPADASWQALLTDSGHDFEKVIKVRQWIEDKMKIVLPAPGENGYDPDGSAGSNGLGWRTFRRWDITPQAVEKELPGHALTHETSANDFGGLVKAWLHNGGQITNTVERLRTGVSISSGMSPTADLGTGGANYFFTRIKSKAAVSRLTRGFVFKLSSLTRMDAISYDGDYYGNVTPQRNVPRATSIAGWKHNSTNSSNETIFKNGLDLLNDIQAIRCNPSEKADILQAFKDFGILQLPDGRPVSALFKREPKP